LSDFGSSFTPQISRHLTSASSSVVSAWRRIASSARDSWVRLGGMGGWRPWAIAAVPLFVVLLIAAAIGWYAGSPERFRKAPIASTSSALQALLLANRNKPKPAPGKTMQAAAHPAPSAYSPVPLPAVQLSQQADAQAPIPTQSIAGATAPPAIVGPAAPAIVIPPRPAFSSMTYHARHDKVFGEGCAGQLILNSGGLVFDCPEDPRSSVQIALSEIGAVDENGVRLLSGKKFHFSIRGMTKSGEEALFTNWLHQLR
jgi:hypothetical protein